MNDLIEILASMIGPGGHVIHEAGDGEYFLGDQPVSPELVFELERRGWIMQTRRPVVAGSSLTGRRVITAMGKRAVYLMRERVA